jgi:hypothetical protein
VPAIDGVLELLAGDDAVSGGSRRNRDHAETFTTFGTGVEEVRRRLLCDATTSGGLLAAVAPKAAPSLPGPVRRDRRRGARRRRGAVMALQRPPGAARARWPIRSSKPAGRGTPRWKVRLLRRSV